MRLNAAVYSGIQGEGVLSGIPSVFVRFWGEVGGYKHEFDAVNAARLFRRSHAVVTGDDPVLHKELPDLIVALQTSYLGENPTSVAAEWPGMHVTVETPAAEFDEAVARHADLMSISPKLSDWPDEPVMRYLQAAALRSRPLQIKVVVSDLAEAQATCSRFEEIHAWLTQSRFVPELVHFVLQPSSSLGRRGFVVVHQGLDVWTAAKKPGYAYPVIRLLTSMQGGWPPQ